MNIFLLLVLSSLMALVTMAPLELGHVRRSIEEGNLESKKGLTFSFAVIGGGEVPIGLESSNWRNALGNLVEKMDSEEAVNTLETSDIYGVLVGAGVVSGGAVENIGRVAEQVEDI